VEPRPPGVNRRPPARQHRSPWEQDRPPAEQHRPAARQHRPSALQHRPPIVQHRIPAGSMVSLPCSMALLLGRIAFPAGSIVPPVGSIVLPACSIPPSVGSTAPLADSVALPADGIALPAHSIVRPGCSIAPTGPPMTCATLALSHTRAPGRGFRGLPLQSRQPPDPARCTSGMVHASRADLRAHATSHELLGPGLIMRSSSASRNHDGFGALRSSSSGRIPGPPSYLGIAGPPEWPPVPLDSTPRLPHHDRLTDEVGHPQRFGETRLGQARLY
jgi:hypothetical protein